jgi:hypothetical protein
MKSMIIGASLVLALLTAAEAAPLYLRCDGKVFVTNEPITYYVKIDGKEVTVENYPPVPVDDDLDEVLSFGLKPSIVGGAPGTVVCGGMTLFDAPRTFPESNVGMRQSDSPCCRASALGERDRARAGTAADIDNAFAPPQLRLLQRRSAESDPGRR